MNKQIFDDAQKAPRGAFVWNGPLDKQWIDSWLNEQNLLLPADIIDLWVKTGGGDIFESETILGPKGNSELGDDVEGVNAYYHTLGLPTEYLIIHTGLRFTAIRLTDGKYITLNEHTFQVLNEYSSLEEWYKKRMRNEYAERYGLKS